MRRQKAVATTRGQRSRHGQVKFTVRRTTAVLAFIALSCGPAAARGASSERAPATPELDVSAQAVIPFSSSIVDSNNPRNPHCKALRDIDGDGQYDIVIASARGGGMYWYEYPRWTKHAIRSSGSWTTEMRTADVDRDGDADVLVPDAVGLKWYRNPRPAGNPRTGALWTEFLIGAAGANSHDVEVGDVNRDGKIDVVSRRKRGGATNVWLQNSPTSWTHVVATARAGEGTALGDIDHDGDLDIAQNGFWLENANGVGRAWIERAIATDWPLDVGVLVVDVDRNGRRDIVLAPSESGGRLSWYSAERPRLGPWTEHPVDGSAAYLHTFKAADMDRDGDIDLVTAEMHQSRDPDEISVYLNTGGGRSWIQQIVATSGSHNLRIGDIDRDGDIDIMGANWNDSAPDSAVIRIWRNNLASRAMSD